MSDVISIRIDKSERAELEKQAKAHGEKLGSYCRRLLERGVQSDATVHAIRAEVRAGVERSEALVSTQAASVQGLIDTLQAALGPKA